MRAARNMTKHTGRKRKTMRNKLLYAYKCQHHNCQEIFETMRLMDERNNPINCPKCGKKAKRTYDSPPPRHVSWGQWNALGD